MMKKFILLMLSLVIFTTTLIAVPVDLTWVWKLNDPDVTTFRFQLDGEDENKWIVVDSSVTSYSAKDLDGTKEYTLYLQQSYDGVFFSKSVKSTNSAIISPESLVAPSENASDVDRQVEAIAKNEGATASRYKRTITIGGDVSQFYGDHIVSTPGSSSIYDQWSLKAEVGLQLKNLLTYNEMLGYGVDIGIAYTPYLNDLYGWRRAFDNMFSNFGEVMDELDHAGTITVASMLNMEFGKFTLNTGLGGFFTYGANYTSVSGQNFMFGPLVKVTFDYQFSDLLSAGLYAKHNVVLVDLDDIRQFSNAGLYMGFSF